jgi:MFS family permease
MYQIENSRDIIKSRRWLQAGRAGGPHVGRTVLLLGLTSFFTDISSEMVSTILPLYMILTLQMAPIEFGVIDGLYQGTASLVRLAGGYIADRWQRYKEVAVVGYALSAICKLGVLLAGNVLGVLTTIIVIDRTGKGIRTAPRDALISLSSPQEGLATAFGVHRALDTAGAMIGPLVAFGVLALVPGAFDAIFALSFCIALIGLAVLTLFVENRPPDEPAATASCPRQEQLGSMTAMPSGSSRSAWRCPGCQCRPPGLPVGSREAVSLRAVVRLLHLVPFRTLLLIGAALSLATISEGFLYLSIQRRMGFNVGLFPLLYVVTALIFMVLAMPVGRLADRVGRGRVFIAGYALLWMVYVLLLLPSAGWLDVCIVLPLFGTYYAATDGVLMAQASAILPTWLRSSGLALLSTATGLARLLASVLFGLLWTWWGVNVAIILFLGALAVIIALALVGITRTAAGPATSTVSGLV